MTQTQKIIKYFAIGLAVLLIISIISGILSVLGVISNSFVNFENEDTIDELNLGNDAKILDIDLKSTNLTIKIGSNLRAETNNEDITINNKNNRMSIKENKLDLFKNNVKDLTVYVPKNLIFDGVSINAGAGKINIEYLNTQSLYLDLGAGNVNISNVITNKNAEIDGGAGNLVIENSSINNLELDLGVGELKLTSVLQGDIDINTGIGSSDINIIGHKDDYRIEVDKGIGKITIDGKSVKNEYTIGSGINTIDIDGGIGDIKVNFQN